MSETKSDLLKKAKKLNLDISDSNTVKEIKEALNSAKDESIEVVSVDVGKATPQNGVKSIETTPAPNEIAKVADDARTKEEIRFADEANPNFKGRGNAGDTDQDGNVRTGGKSYGVAL